MDDWRATLKLAEIASDDAKKLVKKGAAARFALDQRQAEGDKASAELSKAEYNPENTVVKAPGDGIVSLVSLHPGQRVDPSAEAPNFIGSAKTWIAAAFKRRPIREADCLRGGRQHGRRAEWKRTAPAAPMTVRTGIVWNLDQRR